MGVAGWLVSPHVLIFGWLLMLLSRCGQTLGPVVASGGRRIPQVRRVYWVGDRDLIDQHRVGGGRASAVSRQSASSWGPRPGLGDTDLAFALTADDACGGVQDPRNGSRVGRFLVA